MQRPGLAAAVICGALANTGAGAQDATAGEEIYQGVCRNCHGPTAKGMASYPKLVGRSADYLSGRLATYRAGEKVGHNSALMIPQARNLSDEDIANVVAYILSLD
jgi:cytochrome c553